jgi:acyl-CoA dehydrogenase
MNTYVSPWMDEDLAIFREAAARFLEAEMVPNEDQWRKQQHVGKDIWRKAGAMGLLCTDVSADYGGVGGDFRHEVVLYEELARRGLSGFGQGVHSICAHYLVNHGTEEQKHRFLPRMASGELIGAIGMTEPGAGSDLQGLKTRAVRDGDDYVINGSKIFITNGYLAGADRRGRRGRDGRSPGRNHQVREGPQGLRQEHRGISEHQVQTG